MFKMPSIPAVIPFLFLLNCFASCSTPGPSKLFGKKSAHEDYGDKIRNAGLTETALGRRWFEVAEHSLTAPLTVKLPFSETGYFAAEEPKAVGILFNAKRGQKLTLSLTKKPAKGFGIYLDIWKPAANAGSKPDFLFSADTAAALNYYEVAQDGNYILRLQPELLTSGEYTLSISTGPSLAFPVAPRVKSNIGSFWGAGRDAGARKHEGIDIFAPKRAPLVAAADGVITRVNENTLGGKVIFLSLHDKNYTLYYAHLDEQLAEPGQRVVAGDTIGLVGNTGNARTTSPHLHFGIYTSGGAIDPLPFVDRQIQSPDKITASLSLLGSLGRSSKSIPFFNSTDVKNDFRKTIEANTLVKVEAATSSWYKVSLPDGETGFVNSGNIASAATPIKKILLKNSLPLLDQPADSAARKAVLAAGQTVTVLATYSNYYFVNSPQTNGWLSRKLL